MSFMDFAPPESETFWRPCYIFNHTDLYIMYADNALLQNIILKGTMNHQEER